MTLRLDPDGAEHYPALVPPADMPAFHRLGERIGTGTAGRRLAASAALARLTGPDSAACRLAARILGSKARAVRAVLFDKTAANNWPLGWHQDRTICVTARAEVAGFGPFTVKQGLLHVQPPVDLLSRMITLRAHLDPCGPGNAPLRVAPGSHLSGLVPSADIAAEVARRGEATCLADTGDVWAYRTLILHASGRAAEPSRRRVLQVDFAAEDLPAPLSWAGL